MNNGVSRRMLVTGGAGFIGSHVVDTMLAEGHQVTAYDNLSSGQARWLAQHRGNPRFELAVGDLLEAERLKQVVAGHDTVWHFAANTDLAAGTQQPDRDLQHCVIGTWNLLDAMRQGGVRELLFASTGTVYGESVEGVMAETSGPLLPISLYAAGKLSCEAFVSAYCHLFGLRAWIFRFGNVVGGRMSHGVIHDFVAKLRRSPAELEVLGDGRQQKPYFLVEECIGGMLHARREVPLSDEHPCDLFNLGTESTTTVASIARIVIEEMGLPNARVRYTGGRRGWPGDQPWVQLSLEKMRHLGWQTRHSSDEAVRIAARRLQAEAALPGEPGHG